MTLSKNDVSGQRGEGYMLVPLAARTRNPGFWGWPARFSQGDVYIERTVVVLAGGAPSTQRIYHQDTKNEFRLGTALYFSGASDGAVLEVVRDPQAGIDFSYALYEPGSERHDQLRRRATEWAGSGNKRWGYF